MKKLIAILIAGLTVSSSYGQFKEKSVMSVREDAHVNLTKTAPATQNYHETKKTRAASRWVNVVDAKDKELGGAILNNVNTTEHFGLMWQDSTMKALYNSTAGLVQDFIWIKSIAQILDPGYVEFNNANYAGTIAFERGKAYNVDSVGILGFYQRNPNKPNIVDTLIVSVASNADMGSYYFTSTSVTNNYGVDTVKFAGLDLNFPKLAIEGTTTIIKKIPLNVASLGDTIPGGLHYFQTPINLSVPATGINLAGITVTFKSGDTWTPLVDSIGSATTIFNNFRFVSFEEAGNTYRSYTKGDWNSSHLFVQDTAGWGTLYVPSFAFSSPSYGYEHHFIDWKLTCPTCTTPSAVVNVTNNVGDVVVYPNPTTSTVNVKFTTTEFVKNSSIQIADFTGKVVKTVSLGSHQANGTAQSSVSVSDLAPGLYVYTINADGQKVSDKLVIR